MVFLWNTNKGILWILTLKIKTFLNNLFLILPKMTEEDIYADSEDLIENDELSPEEEAFMAGYNKAAEDEEDKDEEEME